MLLWNEWHIPFVKCLKEPPSNFNTLNYFTFNHNSTRLGSSNKLKHTSSSSITTRFFTSIVYFSFGILSHHLIWTNHFQHEVLTKEPFMEPFHITIWPLRFMFVSLLIYVPAQNVTLFSSLQLLSLTIIKKYNSASEVKDAAGLKWPPIHKYVYTCDAPLK